VTLSVLGARSDEVAGNAWGMSAVRSLTEGQRTKRIAKIHLSSARLRFRLIGAFVERAFGAFDHGPCRHVPQLGARRPTVHLLCGGAGSLRLLGNTGVPSCACR
jgi:hypothetical protein